MRGSGPRGVVPGQIWRWRRTAAPACLPSTLASALPPSRRASCQIASCPIVLSDLIGVLILNLNERSHPSHASHPHTQARSSVMPTTAPAFTLHACDARRSMKGGLLILVVYVRPQLAPRACAHTTCPAAGKRYDPKGTPPQHQPPCTAPPGPRRPITCKYERLE